MLGLRGRKNSDGIPTEAWRCRTELRALFFRWVDVDLRQLNTPAMTTFTDRGRGREAAGDALNEAIVRSARQRCLALSGLLLILCLPLVVFAAGFRFGVSGTDPDSVARLARFAPAVLLGSLLTAVCEIAAWAYLGRIEREGRRIPAVLPVTQTAVTILITIMVIFVAVRTIGPQAVSVGAYPWLLFPVIVLSALYLRFGLCVFAGALAAGGFLVAAESAIALGSTPDLSEFGRMRLTYYYKAAILLGTGVITGLIAVALRRHLLAAVAHAAERDRAIGIFGQHVSPAVARRLLGQPLPERGEARHVCVLFLDIRNFSKFAAEHPANEVMGYLNTLFEPLIELVNGHRGVVNKFLGDGFMAVFGAPSDDGEPERDAARCALKLLAATKALADEGRIPATRLGIGLHSGESVTGIVGTETRKEYTVIGDTVNIAARIEQATKTCEAQLLVSDIVRDELSAVEFPGEDLGLIELKGQPQPIRLHRLA